MGRVNIVKQIKVDGKWRLASIPKKKSGHYYWAALPDGNYFIEWREEGRRRRQPAGKTAAQAMEEQRRKRHELEANALGLAPQNERLRRRINEIRDVRKHGSPQRRDHRPILQAERKAWPDPAPPPGENAALAFEYTEEELAALFEVTTIARGSYSPRFC